MRSLIIIAVIVINVTISAAGQLVLNADFNAGVTEGQSRGLVSVILPDGKILVGGTFHLAGGIRRGGVARLNADGLVDVTFNATGTGADGSVFDIKVLTDGKIMIAGGLLAYNGTPVGKIARLNSDGTLDPTFNSGGIGVNSDATVQFMTVQPDGKYLLSGTRLLTYNGVPRVGVIRLNANGSLDEEFAVPFEGFPFVEQTALQSDGKIVIGGRFSLGGAYDNIARLNNDGTVDSTFGSGQLHTDGQVYSVLVGPDERILIAGEFSLVNTSSRRSVAMLNSDGSLNVAFNPQITEPSEGEDAIFKPDGKILLAGFFFPDAAGLSLPVIQLNADGSIDNSFNPPRADNDGYHITLQSDQRILLTGPFVNIAAPNLGHQNFVRLNSDGSLDNSFGVSFGRRGAIEAMLEQSDGKYLVAGDFYRANGNAHRSLARFNSDGTVDESFQSGWGLYQNITVANTSFSSFVVAEQPGGKLLLGSALAIFVNNYNQSEVGELFRVDSNGSLDTSFTAEIPGTGTVRDVLVESDGKIIVVGNSLGGSNRMLLRLHTDGALDSSFPIGIGTGAGVTAHEILQLPDEKLVVAGNFISYLSVPRNNIVRLNSNGSVDTSFDPGSGTNGRIITAALQGDGKILIAGTFTAFNGTPRSGLARLNSNGSLDPTFDPGTGINSGGLIRNIVLQSNEKILIGGNFSNYNGSAVNDLARLNPDGSFDSSAVTGLSNDSQGFVSSVLVTSDQQILIGGIFDNYNGVPKNNIAKLSIDAQPTSAPFDYDADGRTDFSIFRPTEAAWYLQKSTEGFFGIQFGVASDKITPADFDGDEKTDIAVYRPSEGRWYVANSSNGTFSTYIFGVADDLPAPADYDGDGRADVAVFRPFDGTWYVDRSSSGFLAYQFGAASDKPTVGDFDGDGLSDFGVYRTTNGEWYQHHSSDGSIHGEQFGFPTDKLAYADYDGDGKTDLAIFRPEDRIFYIRNSQTATYTAVFFGVGTDIPAPGDFDGDGRADISVFRPSDGHWYRFNSSNGAFEAFHFGANGDRPTPTAFLH